MRLPEFQKHLEMSLDIHIKKNQDYASEVSPLENFQRSSQIAQWFIGDSADVAYATLIGVKLARLGNLLARKNEPRNEPIDDTFLDLMTYVNLWWCDYERRNPARNNDEAASNTIRTVSSRTVESDSISLAEGIESFARKKAEECAGTFIPNRTDAIIPFAHKLEDIIKEWVGIKG